MHGTFAEQNGCTYVIRGVLTNSAPRISANIVKEGKSKNTPMAGARRGLAAQTLLWDAVGAPSCRGAGWALPLKLSRSWNKTDAWYVCRTKIDGHVPKWVLTCSAARLSANNAIGSKKWMIKTCQWQEPIGDHGCSLVNLYGVMGCMLPPPGMSSHAFDGLSHWKEGHQMNFTYFQTKLLWELARARSAFGEPRFQN